MKSIRLQMLVLPDDELDCGILVIEDVSEQARMLQKMNQQKYGKICIID